MDKIKTLACSVLNKVINMTHSGEEILNLKHHCKPKHWNLCTWQHLLPRNGIFFSRAYLMAFIFPSVPRAPNPPGTITPLQDNQRSGKYNKGTDYVLCAT